MVVDFEASKHRVESLQGLHSQMEELADSYFHQKRRNKYCYTAWIYISRLITIGSIVLSAMIGTVQLDLHPTTITTLGVTLAVVNAINGIVNEVIKKFTSRMTEIDESTTLVTLAQIKLHKTFDASIKGGQIKTRDYQGILESLTPAMKTLSTEGLGWRKRKGENHEEVTADS